LDYQGVDGRIIIKWILQKEEREVMDWINLAHESNKCYVLCNGVVGFIKCGEFLN
jgi:hypothetical protein